MHPQKDLAIVLRSVLYEERNRIVTALTEQNGLVTGFAKNAVHSRRFGGCLDVFAASEWFFSQRAGSDMCLLTEAHIREPFAGLRTEFKKLAMGSVLNELMIKLAPPYQACPDLFRLHSNALSFLSSCPAKMEYYLLNAYLAKLLQWSGSQPRIHSCLQCATDLNTLSPQEELSCLISDGAWICANCCSSAVRHIQKSDYTSMEQLKVSVAAMMDFRFFLGVPIKKIQEQLKATEAEHQGLFQFLERLLIYHVPGFDKAPMKSLRFLELPV